MNRRLSLSHTIPYESRIVFISHPRLIIVFAPLGTFSTGEGALVCDDFRE